MYKNKKGPVYGLVAVTVVNNVAVVSGVAVVVVTDYVGALPLLCNVLALLQLYPLKRKDKGSNGVNAHLYCAGREEKSKAAMGWTFIFTVLAEKKSQRQQWGEHSSLLCWQRRKAKGSNGVNAHLYCAGSDVKLNIPLTKFLSKSDVAVSHLASGSSSKRYRPVNYDDDNNDSDDDDDHFYNSPDITLCGWLGSKHQLTHHFYRVWFH